MEHWCNGAPDDLPEQPQHEVRRPLDQVDRADVHQAAPDALHIEFSTTATMCSTTTTTATTTPPHLGGGEGEGEVLVPLVDGAGPQHDHPLVHRGGARVVHHLVMVQWCNGALVGRGGLQHLAQQDTILHRLVQTPVLLGVLH